MREIVKPAAGFLRGISTGNVKLEEGTKKTHEKGTSSSLQERDSSLSKTTGRRACDTRLWIRRKEVDYAPRIDSDIYRNHHVRMKKNKREEEEEKNI